ncbi:MAG: AsmA family protein, partial [Thermohalobaculum sp.]|nr:AsmA family protein [Thermohalobaculum sp.]
MRRLVRLLIAVIAALAVAAGAVVALVVFLPREQVAAIVAQQVEKATGRRLVIEGGLSPSVWPVLGVATGPIRLGNAAWGVAPDMLTAAGVEIGVELLPLLSGDIRVDRLRLIEPVIALEIAADGRANWTLKGATAAGVPAAAGAGGPRALPAIALPAAEIVDGTLRFSDARTGREIGVDELNLTAGLDG